MPDDSAPWRAGSVATIKALPTPTGNALGFRTLERAGDRCVMSVPANPAAMTSTGHVDVGAILALIDQCMGTAAAGEATTPCVTLDLRIDWLAAVPAGSEIFCRAHRVIAEGRWIMVEAGISARGDNAIFASAVGQFFAGTYPGGGSIPQDSVAETITSDWASFADFLALRPGKKGWEMSPSPQTVGTTSLPALHGGIIAAALLRGMLSTAESPANGTVTLRATTFDFLRPGRAAEALRIETRWVRSGRAVGRLAAEAYQQGQISPIATARATVVMPVVSTAADVAVTA